MSIYKRGRVCWYSFVYRGQRIQESTEQGNREVARAKQAARLTELVSDYNLRAKEAERLNCKPEELLRCFECPKLFYVPNPITSPDGQRTFCSETCEDKWRSRQSPTPTMAAFAERFREKMKSDHEAKPKTVSYYNNSLNRLLEHESWLDLRLDRVNKAEIDNYILSRRQAKKKTAKKNAKRIGVATLNRELEVLRRMLRVAQEWGVIARVPKISRLQGEKGRDRVLTHAEEQNYLEHAEEPLREVATIITDTGMRPEEVFRMTWSCVHFQPVGKARFGFIRILEGKTENARRNLLLTQRVQALLEMRHEKQGKPAAGWVFPAATKSGRVESLKSQHKRALKKSKVNAFVLYSLRHTMLTRLGEAGADAFAIQKIAGHSSILISQRYVHPTPERIENSFTLLEAYNSQKRKELEQEHMVQ